MPTVNEVSITGDISNSVDVDGSISNENSIDGELSIPNVLTVTGNALRNIKDAVNGGVIEGLVTDDIPADKQNKATGLCAHAEGGEYADLGDGTMVYFNTIASGQASHAEGSETTASGHYAHAEGMDGTIASGNGSHAEGCHTLASGLVSHAEGVGTSATRLCQHVFGIANVLDTKGDENQKGTYVEIVGNGVYQNDGTTITTTRSNARTLDWGGNEKLAGSITLGMGSNNETTLTAVELKSLKDTIGQTSGPSNIADGTGTGSIVEGEIATNNASGNYSHAEGSNVAANNINSHAEGSWTVSSGQHAHAEGVGCEASGNNSHAEGNYTKATKDSAHSEGSQTTASGQSSHAEGISTTSSGYAAHTEGSGTVGSGDYSHAQGYQTTASGRYAVSSGRGTTANHLAQNVFGEYNVLDASTAAASARGNYVEIVGNGTSINARANARTLDWSGNERLSGSLTLGAGTTDEITLTAAQVKQLLALLS